MQTRKSYISHSEKETAAIAKDMVSRMDGHTVVALCGDLGSGKTTFTKAFAKEIGVKQRIISPTFTIVRRYGFFYHLDLYRIEAPSQLQAIGLPEMFAEKNNMMLIEWAEKAGDYLPKERITIKFEYISDSERKITVLASK